MPRENKGGLPDNFWEEGAEGFVGKIVGLGLVPITVQREGGEETIDRIQMEIEDLSPVTERTRICFFSPSTHQRSKWSRWKKALRENVGLSPRTTADIIDRCFKFQSEDWDYGGGFVASNVPVPVELFPDEETAVAEAEALAIEQGLISEEAVSGGSDVYIRDLIVSELDGRTYQEFFYEILQDETVSSDDELVAKLADQKHRYIEENFVATGLVSKDSDGVYHQTER